MGDALDVIGSGPTVPDSSTYEDALNCLETYGVTAPPAILEHLKRGVEGRVSETPKDWLQGRQLAPLPTQTPSFVAPHICLLASNSTAVQAAKSSLVESLAAVSVAAIGSAVKVRVLETPLTGEAREVASSLAGELVREASLLSNGQMNQGGTTTLVLVGGGETTVTVEGGLEKGGKGGRNTEAALAFALAMMMTEKEKLQHGPQQPFVEEPQWCAAFLATDGSDGPTDCTGAVVCNATLQQAGTVGAVGALQSHDSYTYLKRAESALLFTGPTGTNVCDVWIAAMEFKVKK